MTVTAEQIIEDACRILGIPPDYETGIKLLNGILGSE